MRLNTVLALIAIVSAGTPQPAEARPHDNTRTITSLDDSWHFTLTPDTASDVKAFSTTVDLPHDWSIGLPFERRAPSGNDGGYLPTGTGKYTKTVNLSASQLQNRRQSLLLEGVYERSTVIVNGDTIGYRPYGYSSMIYDITASLHEGENTITVIADNSHQKNSRWYTGSGIYRHMRLIGTGETAVSPWSLFITTPEVTADKATVNIGFDIDGFSLSPSPLSADISISDANGNIVASDNFSLDGEKAENLSLRLDSPSMWSPDSPSLYSLDLTLKDGNGKAIDHITETFGVRTIAYSAEKGFMLNGKPILINGGCVHHDNGILGAASYDAAEARKVRLLKEGGFNAVRTSHNPPSPAFLYECDRQGLLVIDEAFDGWRDAKNDNDYSVHFDTWALRDAGDMVRRDRNHPSVIAWSIGNEVMERKKIEVVTTARRLAEECRRLDPSRPVTSALCSWDSDWEIYDPLAEAHDIVGYNYMIHKAASDHERCPERVIWQTESYPADALDNWRKADENTYIIGDFVWTAIDYIGESGIGRYHYEGETPGEHYQRQQWPWHGAYCGDIDITGWRKPISHYRDMLYNNDRTLYMAVREPDGYNGKICTTQWGVWPTWESWNWAGHEGKPVEVEVMSRYPRVRLYLNGSPAGESDNGRENGYKTVFTVPYAPGVLRACGVDDNGNEVESIEIQTAGEPYAIRLTPDRDKLTADNQDISFIEVEIIDREGRVVPDASVPLEFTVSGPGKIIASGSADMTSQEPYSTPHADSWKGRAIVAVKTSHKPGTILLNATSPGLRKASARLRSK